jgi:DNA-binding Lrp family transcriptional regulator
MRAGPQDGVGPDILRLIAAVEGRSAARGAGAALGRSELMALRLLRRLRGRGLIRTVTAVRPGALSGPCETLVLLGVGWDDAHLTSRLEDRLRQDLRVAKAARISGRYDYAVRAFHAGPRDAQTWFRDLLAQPGVVAGELRFCTTRFERATYAAALLRGYTEAAPTTVPVARSV